MIILILFGVIFLGAFIAVIAGLTLHDVREIRQDNEYRQHPYARKWRKRPLVSIVIDGHPTQACLQSIRSWHYRNVQIVSSGSPVDGDLILSMSPDTTIDKPTFLRAVRILNADASISKVELTPIIKYEETVRGLLSSYRLVATAPFTAARMGLGVSLPQSSLPVLARVQTAPLSIRSKLYLLLRWVVQIANISAVVFAIYLALAIHQPDILLLYMATFSFWLLWSIARYKQMTLGQKIGLLGLAPVSLGSFLYYCVSAPLRLRQYVALLPERRKSGIIATIKP